MSKNFELQETTDASPPKRRRFTRVNVELSVAYAFISSSGNNISDQTFHGTSRDISGGGCLLEGTIPNLEWIPDLLLERIKLKADIVFPQDDTRLHTEGKVAWIDPRDPGEETFQLGLEFEELNDDERKQIVEFVIRETTRES
jgi:c-di-GMP-binding flagellar brake protein YcgR